jgi:hypothetical protein
MTDYRSFCWLTKSEWKIPFDLIINEITQHEPVIINFFLARGTLKADTKVGAFFTAQYFTKKKN